MKCKKKKKEKKTIVLSTVHRKLIIPEAFETLLIR